MAAVVVYPFMKLRAVFADRHTAAMAGAPGAMVTNAPIVPALAASSVELIMCLPGRTRGRDDILPANLKKATMEPVNVTPPRDQTLVRLPQRMTSTPTKNDLGRVDRYLLALQDKQ